MSITVFMDNKITVVGGLFVIVAVVHNFGWVWLSKTRDSNNPSEKSALLLDLHLFTTHGK